MVNEGCRGFSPDGSGWRATQPLATSQCERRASQSASSPGPEAASEGLEWTGTAHPSPALRVPDAGPEGRALRLGTDPRTEPAPLQGSLFLLKTLGEGFHFFLHVFL